jgi:hypothetical protein
MAIQHLVCKYLAAIFGLAAGILLFYSLTITSSPFKPIMTVDGAHLCFDGKLLAAGYGGPLVLTSDPCPGWDKGKPAALVSAEHPNFIRWGLFLLGTSFFLQLLDIGWEAACAAARRALASIRLLFC